MIDPDHPAVFWEVGICNDKGFYKTVDDGVTFGPGVLAHVDLVSIDFTDPNRQTMLAGHEMSQKLSLSTNGGVSSTEIGNMFPSGTAFSSAPLVLDSQTFLVGCTLRKHQRHFSPHQSGPDVDSRHRHVVRSDGLALPLRLRDRVAATP